MAQTRLKSSFIYLANAVHDLTANWRLIAIVLTPLVIASALCLLPDALNLQHEVVRTFTPGTQSVAWHPVQTPYIQTRPVAPLFPAWETRTLHILFALIAVFTNLVVLCALARIHSDGEVSNQLNGVIGVYRRAIDLAPAFGWVILLQLLATAIGFVLLIIPGLLAFIWLYFAQYALVVDDRRSWPALMYSRDLMRGRFFKVAIRIVVFLAVWSGYNSWAGGTFVVLSLLLNLVGTITGVLWAGVFVADLTAVAVAYATTFFFYAAGMRLYQDLNALAQQPVAVAELEPPPTAPLSPSPAL